MYSWEEVLIAFSFTLFAGLATGIGSALAFFAHRTNYRFLAIATGFSAGVMLYVSFTEILTKATDSLVKVYGEAGGNWAAAGAFFGGMVFIGIIDQLIPHAENPHDVRTKAEIEELHHAPPGKGATGPEHAKLMRMGIFTALAIAIHNFPEGLATFLSALEDPSVGLAIAVAIALHNIPEGISVSVPIFYASGSRKKAFWYSFLSGVAEPVGAIVGYLLLLPVLTPQLMGYLFSGVGGIMVYISLDELLPTSRAYGKGHDTLMGLMSGMAVMALSLLLMQ